MELADRARRGARQAFVDDVKGLIPIVAYDSSVAAVHAKLLVATRRQGRRRGAQDLIIAATAKATGREVVSADSSAYEDLPGVSARAQPA